MCSPSAANQKENKMISSSSQQEDAPGPQNSVINLQTADNMTMLTSDPTKHNTPTNNTNGNIPQLAFRMEKPKMPKFSGDVREFAIFKTDFKHLIETRYFKRDSITLRRASLHGKPLELIKELARTMMLHGSIWNQSMETRDLLLTPLHKISPN